MPVMALLLPPVLAVGAGLLLLPPNRQAVFAGAGVAALVVVVTAVPQQLLVRRGRTTGAVLGIILAATFIRLVAIGACCLFAIRFASPWAFASALGLSTVGALLLDAIRLAGTNGAEEIADAGGPSV